MGYLNLKCKECHEEVEVYCDGDNAMICPECRTVDEFEDIEDEEVEPSQEKCFDDLKSSLPDLTSLGVKSAN